MMPHQTDRDTEIVQVRKALDEVQKALAYYREMGQTNCDGYYRLVQREDSLLEKQAKIASKGPL